MNAYGPPPLPVMQQQRPQPRPQSTYYGGDGFVPQQPGYPPPLPPGAPRYYFDPRHGSPSQFPQYQQQQSAIYSPSNYAPSPQLQQSPYAPSSASMSPNPAQMATDYIFQQQQALQQSQSSSAMSHQTYSQDVASPTDHLSDHSSGKVDSPAATSSLSDLTRDPHLSAFMVKPTEGDASTSTAEIAGDEYPVYAQGRRQSDGSSMFEGFSQVNPCARLHINKLSEAGALRTNRSALHCSHSVCLRGLRCLLWPPRASLDAGFGAPRFRRERPLFWHDGASAQRPQAVASVWSLRLRELSPKHGLFHHIHQASERVRRRSPIVRKCFALWPI